MLGRSYLRRRAVAHALATICSFICLAALAPAAAETPEETYRALGLTKEASPKELYDALTKRYYDPAQGAGKGSCRS